MSASAQHATEATLRLRIEGMTCAACVTRVEKALARVPGVADARVNLAAERAEVLVDPTKVTVDALAQAVERVGYGAQAVEDFAAPGADDERIALERREFRVVVAAIALTLPLVAPMASAPFGVDVALPAAAQLVLASLVQFVLGARFYRGAWHALRNATGTMDVLVAMGTSAAFGLSLWTMSGGRAHGAHALYFEAGAAVVTLVLLGKWLEARARRRTADAVRDLLRLRPETVRVLRDGSETVISLDLLRLADRCVVLPGERVPADGTIESGATELDESLVTGESLPVVREAGGRVVGGSLNGTGRIVVVATAVGAESTLVRIARQVESAQSSKAPVQRLVDRVAAVFVPIVVAIALTTFIVWWFATDDLAGAIVPAVAVLVIACPCALGLATPAALVAGLGAAARSGVLIRDAETLERATRIRVVAFDKTGTLTAGRPALVSSSVFPSAAGAASGAPAATVVDAATALGVAAALQAGSEHPLARAFTEALPAGTRVPAATQLRAVPGRGIGGEIDGVRWALGSARFAAELAAPSGDASRWADEEGISGRTVSFLIDVEARAVRAAFAFEDVPRPTARAAVERLAAQGVHVAMLTGDRSAAARHVADALGIDRVVADVLPEDKAAALARLRDEFGPVAMVGDGLNDAPALAAADVGIAMGSGTDVAIHAAGVTLMRADPEAVADALDIARRTHAKIRQNLFWAFAYNVAGLPLAAAGMLDPMLAGAAMAFSSVSVVTNALTLRRWRPRAVAQSPRSASR